jgi:hypothetical protein
MLHQHHHQHREPISMMAMHREPISMMAISMMAMLMASA